MPLAVAGMASQTANLTEWYNGSATVLNNKVQYFINATGATCFGCSGQTFKEQSSLTCQRNSVSSSIFFNGTAMIIRVV